MSPTFSLKIIIQNYGISKGLCKVCKPKLTRKPGIKDLITVYVYVTDFFIKNNYPSLDFLRSEFKGKAERTVFATTFLAITKGGKYLTLAFLDYVKVGMFTAVRRLV
ncbi:MAG: hypothetical protein ACQPRJ_05615 [Solitalea-like symbiont of Acarus siro]